MNNYNEIFENEILLITFGVGSNSELKKVRIKPLIGKEKIFYQEERLTENKAYHNNIKEEDLQNHFVLMIKNEFKNAVIFTEKSDYYFRRSKKGKISVVKKNPTRADLSPGTHNEIKNHLIPEGRPIGFLIGLGLMNEEGQVSKKFYSKFRQINRFIELVDDEWEYFSEMKEVHIADLGCGKGYLTFALHHYFNEIKGIKTKIIGIDLKREVVEKLNNLVEDLSLEGISFKVGDIGEADLDKQDIVVALHACDTATDLSLAGAVKAGARMIMTVPCCQHELFKQINNKDLSPILDYGIMKDKFTELATNALRGLALEASGYKVDMIEFTSLEHTMKNIMIRALLKGGKNFEKENEFKKFCEYLNADPSAKKIIDAK